MLIAESDKLAWNSEGLLPAVIQHAHTRQVLMLGYMNREALDLTQSSGQVHFWSRSRQQLWRKGETSGNTLELRGIQVDCDLDTLLVQSLPAGPTCHTGGWSCFEEIGKGEQGAARLEKLWEVIQARASDPPTGSYTARLLTEEPEGPARKLVEEATETLLSLLAHREGKADNQRVAEEAADLVYHLFVALTGRGVAFSEVLAELVRRSVPANEEK